MIPPVQRVEPVRFLKKKEEIPSFKEEPKENPASYKKKEQKRRKNLPFYPSYSTSTVKLDEETEGSVDHEKAVEQYLYEERRTSTFEAKV